MIFKNVFYFELLREMLTTPLDSTMKATLEVQGQHEMMQLNDVTHTIFSSNTTLFRQSYSYTYRNPKAEKCMRQVEKGVILNTSYRMLSMH